jgi:hypothetical protein
MRVRVPETQANHPAFSQRSAMRPPREDGEPATQPPRGRPLWLAGQVLGLGRVNATERDGVLGSGLVRCGNDKLS